MIHKDFIIEKNNKTREGNHFKIFRDRALKMNSRPRIKKNILNPNE